MMKVKTLSIGAAVWVGTLLLCFLVAEAGYRVLKGFPLLSTDNLVLQSIDLIRANTGAIDFDSTLGWRLSANKLNPGGISTGPLGVRMNETRLAPLRSGGALVVGDSITAGSGVNDDQSWTAFLEKDLNRPVLNAAVGAYGVDQMVLRAESLLPEVKPEVLIVSVLSQASLRNSYSVYGGGYKPYFVIENGHAVLQGVPVPPLMERPPELGLVRSVLGHSYIIDAGFTALGWRDWWVNNSYRFQRVHTNEVGVEISCLLMDRLAELKRRTGLRVVVLMLYGAGEIEADPPPWYAAPVIACAKERGLEGFDSYEAFRALLKHEHERFVNLWLDEGGQLGHLSPAGHRFVADLVRSHFFAPWHAFKEAAQR